MKLSILANGPGEVWAWTRPVVMEAKRRGWDVQVWLAPCPFASGREAFVLEELGVSVVSPQPFPKLFWRLAASQCCDAVLQLGGDLIFGRFLAWRHKALLACYTYGSKKGLSRCDAILTSRDGLLPQPKAQAVGDLVLDSLPVVEPIEWKAPVGQRLVVFPGSRPSIRRLALSFLKEACDILRQALPQLEVRIPLSPFAEASEAEQWRAAGFSLFEKNSASVVSGADLVVTQPGTNTLELLYLAQPMMVAAPLSFVSVTPMSGLLGMLTWPSLRVWAFKRLARRFQGRTSWPNRLTQRAVVPELVGDFDAAVLAEEIARQLQNAPALKKQKEELHRLACQVMPGAAARICDVIEGKLNSDTSV